MGWYLHVLGIVFRSNFPGIRILGIVFRSNFSGTRILGIVFRSNFSAVEVDFKSSGVGIESNRIEFLRPSNRFQIVNLKTIRDLELTISDDSGGVVNYLSRSSEA